MESPQKSPPEEPKKKYRGIKVMPYIIGNETFEKLGTIGTSTNLMVYLTTVFNLKRVTAATLINVWNGTCNLSPMIGAFLSDAYFGRFKTLGFASVASLLGMILFMLTAAVPKLHPPHCVTDGTDACSGPTTYQLVFLLTGLGFLVIGAGGIRSCNLAFGADQFDPTTDSGKQGVNSFFNWYFFTFTFAMMVALTLIVWVQVKVSWSLGLAIPAVLMFLSCTFFFVGDGIYVKVEPEGSPFSSVAQVAVAAIKKRGLKNSQQPEQSLFNPPHSSSLVSKLPYTNQFRCLDKAAIITDKDEITADGSPANPWRLCGIQQVEEVKCIVRVMPIWAAGILFSVAVVQQQTYVVVQALQSDRRLGKRFEIPAASFIVFSMFALTLWIPIYDRMIVPAIRKITGREGGITLLQRMGIGAFLTVVAMVVSGLVEKHRRSVALHHPTLGTADGGGQISAMSSLWLVPQLMITGLSEAFGSVAQLEFYYKQFPENRRSVAGSLIFLGMAGSNYLSSFLVTAIHRATERAGRVKWLPEDLNKGRLEYFYFTIAGLGIVNFVYFLICARWYRYKGVDTDFEEIEMASNKTKASPV
ncbi:protein NRT1/ PTR FAMILY 2.11-like [Aristolochia californica]|uniref:protein NRT1/ PTR FAMILY 2.11-like n=1 Tax=Aristolochia californica TaxID=171875 RepID=UPI0035D7F3FF